MVVYCVCACVWAHLSWCVHRGQITTYETWPPSQTQVASLGGNGLHPMSCFAGPRGLFLYSSYTLGRVHIERESSVKGNWPEISISYSKWKTRYGRSDYNPSTWEGKAEGIEIQGHFWLHRQLENSLGFKRLHLKKRKRLVLMQEKNLTHSHGILLQSIIFPEFPIENYQHWESETPSTSVNSTESSRAKFWIGWVGCV